MDRYTRNYLVLLSLIAAGILAWWLSGLDFRAGEINDILAEDPEIAAYPYPFRVISVKDGSATLSSPRSFEVPVIRFLGIIQPGLAGKAQTDPEVMAAQAELVRVQKHAAALVKAQPDVNRVRWQLDRDWYLQRGISLP